MSDEETTLPPEMLPRSPGADVIIVCPSCEWRWVPEDIKCPNCGRGNAARVTLGGASLPADAVVHPNYDVSNGGEEISYQDWIRQRRDDPADEGKNDVYAGDN